MQEVLFEDLGRRAYKETWDFQESLLKENAAIKAAARQEASFSPKESATRNYLFFVEHEPVFTLGKNGNDGHVLISESEQAQRGISYYHINRGGDITFHGPGQLVGYPILDLEKFRPDLGWYLRSLEEVIIRTMADYGLEGKRSTGETGVWLDPDVRGRERKICAMGIKCSRWITMHGFALNVNTDLRYFDLIVPCGITGKQVTSLEKELGRKVPMQEVAAKIRGYFEQVFDCRLVDAKDLIAR